VSRRAGLNTVTKRKIPSLCRELNPCRPARSLLNPKTWMQPVFSTGFFIHEMLNVTFNNMSNMKRLQTNLEFTVYGI